MAAILNLSQGVYNGKQMNGIYVFHNVPYAKPFRRFEAPSPIEGSTDSESSVIHNATKFGFNCPQRVSRLENVMGSLPEVAEFDEFHCNVLSIYSPALPKTGNNKRRPVIVWFHGGAFTSGGSQIAWYDGSRLAKDGDVVVVCVNYRLSTLGFLQDDARDLQSSVLPMGTADVALSLEWVNKNIEACGGNAGNITLYGQSAGGYHVQTMFDLRPNLFQRAIIQSSPASEVVSPRVSRALRQDIIEALASSITVETASIQELSAAEVKAISKHADLLAPFMPASRSFYGPAMMSPASNSTPKKDVLIGWTKDDGLCFARIRNPEATVDKLDHTLTRAIFKIPSLALAGSLHKDKHNVATFELTWQPEGFDLGATHCTDLPLVFGDREAWKDSPMMGSASWDEWERRGKRHRIDIGRFALDGTVPGSHDGMAVHSVSDQLHGSTH